MSKGSNVISISTSKKSPKNKRETFGPFQMAEWQLKFTWMNKGDISVSPDTSLERRKRILTGIGLQAQFSERIYPLSVTFILKAHGVAGDREAFRASG